MSSKIKYTETQKLFPHYTLNKQEIDWVRTFELETNFDVLYSNTVVDQETFLEFVKLNIEWFYDWYKETIALIEKKSSVFYNKIEK